MPNERGSFAFIIPVLVLLIGLAAIGWYFYQEKVTTQVQIQPISSSSPSPSTIPSQITENWKTFTNSKFGYSFEYPPLMEINRCTDDSCGETIFLRKTPGKLEVSGENSYGKFDLIDSSCANGYKKVIQTDNLTNNKRASLQAQCNLPGIANVNDPVLPAVDENFDSKGLFQYSFYLQGAEKHGPYYAAFFPQAVNDLDINNDPITYYGIIYSPNFLGEPTQAQLELLNQVLPSFKFTDTK